MLSSFWNLLRGEGQQSQKKRICLDLFGITDVRRIQTLKKCICLDLFGITDMRRIQTLKKVQFWVLFGITDVRRIQTLEKLHLFRFDVHFWVPGSTP